MVKATDEEAGAFPVIEQETRPSGVASSEC